MALHIWKVKGEQMIYSYKCEKCNLEFDKNQSIGEDVETRCENCCGEVSRIISGAPAFILKGSGWAKDGYK